MLKLLELKNRIIDIIEQNEGIDSYDDTKEGSVIGNINSYLNTVGYYVNLANIKKIIILRILIVMIEVIVLKKQQHQLLMV